MPVYASDGTIASTVVTGASITGLYAADGSINIVLDDGSNKGVQHPCGALRVNSSSGVTYYDASGAIYINHLFGSGTTGTPPAPGTAYTYYILGF